LFGFLVLVFDLLSRLGIRQLFVSRLLRSKSTSLDKRDDLAVIQFRICIGDWLQARRQVAGLSPVLLHLAEKPKSPNEVHVALQERID
jgi:hypothetical protein